MSKLIVNTIEAQTFNYDSDTTGMTIDSTGRLGTNSDRPSFYARAWAGSVTNPDNQGSHFDAWYFTTVDHNQGNHFSNSSSTGGKFVAPIAGLYFISGGFGYKEGTNHTGLYVYKNTTNIFRAWTVNTSPQHHNATWSGSLLLAANDEVTIGHHNSYEAPNSSTSTPYIYFTGIFMG